MNPSHRSISRRSFLGACSTTAVASAAALRSSTGGARAEDDKPSAMAQTVLGPVAADSLGVALMHEHAPTVDWSELYDTMPAPLAGIREEMLANTARLLDAFHNTLAQHEKPGTIVETTPIRVGRYPQTLVDLARKTKVHIVAATGFWCEALAPQHPWAVRLGIERDGVQKMAELFIREITQGMEDPRGAWGDTFTEVKAGIIKIGTSTYLRPSERACHVAAALASRETGCPITTHTTNGGGLEQAEFLVAQGARPDRVIIGHQGHQDDRQHEEADEYHALIAKLGCYVQFDRVGHGNYGCDKQARQIKKLIDKGFVEHVLVSHDLVPYYCANFTSKVKDSSHWTSSDADYTVVTKQLVKALQSLGTSPADLRSILVENPRRVLAFIEDGPSGR